MNKLDIFVETVLIPQHLRVPGTVLVHEVRKLASLGTQGPGQPAWAARMARMRRKTLAVCRACHDVIHRSPVMNTA